MSFPAGLTASQKVSGTNVNFTTNGSTSLVPAGITPANPGVTWYIVTITSRNVRIGGNTLTLPTLNAPDDQWAESIRFASTHFASGATPSIEVETTWYLEGIIGTTIVYENPTVVSSVTVEVFNQFMAWATQETLAASIAKASAAHAKAKVGSNASEPYHYDIGPSAPNFNATTVEITDLLGSATFIHADSHGSSGGIESSDQDFMDWDEITEGVNYRDTGVPFPNMVVSYCCSSLATPFNAADSFNLRNGSIKPDKAIAGFETDFLAGFGPADEYCEEFYKSLASGKTVKQACKDANDAVFLFISNSSESQALLTYHGDQHATIRGVYTASEVTSRPWYKVL